GLFYCLDYLYIPRTPAEVTLYRRLYIIDGRVGVGVEQCFCRHDHSRRTVPALDRAFLQECLLYEMDLFGETVAQALDSPYLRAIHLHNRKYAGINGLAVDDHRACPAFSHA